MWWKRIPAFNPTRRRNSRHQVDTRLSLDQDLYVRSILESFGSSMSSNPRVSTSNRQLLTEDSDGIRSSDRGAKRQEEEEGKKESTRRTLRGIGTEWETRSPHESGANGTPSDDTIKDQQGVEMDDGTPCPDSRGLLGRSGRSSDLSRGSDEEGLFVPSSFSEDDEKSSRRFERRMKRAAMRTQWLERNQQTRTRSHKKMCIFLACIGVTLTAFVVAAIVIARVGVELQTSSFSSRNTTTPSNSNTREKNGNQTSDDGPDWTPTGSKTFDASPTLDNWPSSSGSHDQTRVHSNTYRYIHCILMVLSLWMSLVVVIMHVTFASFRTYSHAFVMELACVQCGYWITSLLRIMLETSPLTDVAYLFLCLFECFFNFAHISFACAIAFNMYRSVVSYADVLMDSQRAKRRYHRYTINVLLLSVLAAVTLALMGYRSEDTYNYNEWNERASSDKAIQANDRFAPCLDPTCRLILYVYYPVLAFGFNFIIYVRFKRTIGESYPTSATGRLNQVARSYLLVFFGCWGSLLVLTALKVANLTDTETLTSAVMQWLFDLVGIGTAVITWTNFHRCRKAFDFGLSLKAIDPHSIEFDEPVNIVGEGTFAIVLKARWRQGGYSDGARSVEVAVKTFKQAQLACLEQIKEEAYLSSKLVHPCVMMTYGCYTSGINLYIVYEYLGGGTLQDLIDANRTTPFSYERGLRYAHMIAVGMRFLHGLPVPIVHRDLKPLNCIFDAEQEMLKVADFGESRLFRTRDRVPSRLPLFPSADLTLQMTTNIGSACWAAPEVLKDEATAAYSVKIDVYSFGIICWQLYTCAIPYADIPGSVLAVAEAVLSGVRPTIPRDCPRLFTKIMKRCWHDNPIRRPSFADIVQLLEIELTDERQRQLARSPGRDNAAIMAPPTLDNSNYIV